MAVLTNTNRKILSLRELAEELEHVRRSGRRVVMAHGVFDLIHPGHIRHLEGARSHGDVLVVTLTPDHFVNKGPGRPVFTHSLRAESLAALACVDYVAVNEWPTAVETIRMLRPDLYIKGSDYEQRDQDITGKIFEEEEAVRSVGGILKFTNDITFSSTALLNSFFGVYSEVATQYLRGLRERVSADDFIGRLEGLNGLKVLLIGDTIIDEYHYVVPLAKSPKENIIATRFLNEERFAGGVLAAANHVASLCERVDVITCLGVENSHEEFVKQHLKVGIGLKVFHRDDAPTVVKRRFVEQSYTRKLFEVCFLEDRPVTPDFEADVCRYLEQVLPEYDLVIVTDFGHGFIGNRTIQTLCEKSRFLAVNAQTNSANLGYNLITRYPRADYLSIDTPEARLATQDRVGDLPDVIKRLRDRVDCEKIAITYGNHGCVVYGDHEGFCSIPAFTTRAVDTVGAGDAFLAMSAPCVAAGMPMEWAGLVGNAAGALKVGIVGHRSSIERVPLLKSLAALLK